MCYGLSMAEIYALLDPETREIRYIGKAKSAKRRYAQHLRDARRLMRPVNCWVLSLLNAESVPELTVLATCSDAEWEEFERAAIATVRSSGARLLNLADGGSHIPATVEQRRKCAETATRKRALTERSRKIWTLKRNLAGALKKGHVNEKTKAKIRSRPDIYGALVDLC